MLQHCAILSQLNRHKDALDISKATALLIKEITTIASTIIKAKRDNKVEQERHEALTVQIDQIIIKRQEEVQQQKKMLPRKGSVSNCSRSNPYSGQVMLGNYQRCLSQNSRA